MEQLNPSLEQAKKHTQKWMEKFVLNLTLCPFAKAPHLKNTIRYQVSSAQNEKELLEGLQQELLHLHTTPIEECDTTVFVHPYILKNFFKYNEFLELADKLLIALDLEGEIQVASFHPDYLFAGCKDHDVENYTNRSPYPMLHLIRESEISKAIEEHPNVDQIPSDNIKKLQTLGIEKIQEMWKSCFV